MVATPLLRQRLLREEEKENQAEQGAGPGVSPPMVPRRVLFEHSNPPLESPWESRAKATLQGVATARVSPRDAERTRANVVKARQAIERWAKITGADDENLSDTARTRATGAGSTGVRCSPDVRVSQFLGFHAEEKEKEQEEEEYASSWTACSGGTAAGAFPSHPQISAALEASAHQLRVCEDRVQKEERKVGLLRAQLAREREQRAEREQQWEALHGRCEQRIRVLEKLRRSEHAEAREEAQRLDAERCVAEELCAVRLVTISHRAWRVRTLRRCVAVWAQECHTWVPGQILQLLGATFRAWAHHAQSNGLRAKLREQEDRLALQNKEYLTAISNVKNSAQKKLDAALEAQRNELMQKHAKTLSRQQHDFDEQHAASAVLLHSVTTSMHVRYCAGLLRAAFGWLRELSTRRRRMGHITSVHHQVQTRWRCLKDISSTFQHWAHVTVTATCDRLECLATGISARRNTARRRSVFKVWVSRLQKLRRHARFITFTAARRQCRMASSCYRNWRAHTAAQRLQKSTLYKFVGRLSNMVLWSKFESWRDFAWYATHSFSIVIARLFYKP
eukprot:COSAG02_NODE_963_length_15604_cov_10.737117_12_plen_565_part_00